MAHALAAAAVMREIVSRLGESLPDELKGPPINATVARLGGKRLRETAGGPVLGLYLYRFRTDHPASHGPAPPLAGQVPLTLHFLLVALADDPEIETELMNWGMRQMARMPIVTLEHETPPHADLSVALVKARIVEDDLPTETLMQVWTAMRTDYRLSTPYVVHGLILSS